MGARSEPTDFTDFPTLRLELEASRQTLVTALTDRHDDLVKMIHTAFEHALPHLQRQADAAVVRVLDQVLARAEQMAVESITDDLLDRLATRMGEVFSEAMRERLTRPGPSTT